MSSTVRQDVGHLRIGCRYRVVCEFKDYDGVVHPVGETWTFQGADFLPYEDGYSFYVSIDRTEERRFRMQDRFNTQAAFFSDTMAYICAVPPEPPSVDTTPPTPAPATNASQGVGVGADAAAAPAQPRRFSLGALLERRKVARERYKAAARRLRRNPPLWLVVAGLLVSAEFIREALHARAHGETISFGHYGDYPWWFAMSLGVVGVPMFTLRLAWMLVKRIRR